MNKAVLISIKPEWCAKIISGRKTIEVRKKRPNLATPFKCYIYCTKGIIKIFYGDHVSPCMGNGKVIGEFVCDRIHRIAIIDDECVDIVDCNTSCLSSRDILNYANGNPLYGWHISNLVIYDKPKELSEFARHDNTYDNAFGGVFEDRTKNTPINKPPQSWCYVEEIN